MQRKLILSVLILSSAVSATAMADDSTTGALVGGGIGAVVGHAMGGRNGTLVGGILGAVVGSSVASANQGYSHGDQTYYHDGGYNTGYAVNYSQPAQVVYAPPPPPRVVYVPQPVYAQPPVYAAPVAVGYYHPAPVYVNYQPVRYVRYGQPGWHRDGRWDHDHYRF